MSIKIEPYRINFNLSITMVFVAFLFSTILGCKDDGEKKSSVVKSEVDQPKLAIDKPDNIETPKGMVWVSGKTFLQGAKDGDEFAMPREKPAHKVSVDGFFIDETEVNNREFSAFVDATEYKTVAERPIDWEQMKKDLPDGTPKPHDSILQPGSLIFNRNVDAVVSMQNYGQWWTWKIGANWKQPYGPDSDIDGREDFPVVHIAYEDALAYCKWANRRLPTEAEWESAAQGINTDNIHTWGNDSSILNEYANTWQGVFPVKNESVDGFEYIAPSKSFPANSIGIYDMLGNVWEWTNDYYNENYYNEIANTTTVNPSGASKHYNPSVPYQIERIIKGGSYLCHDSYCASFRISAKMGMSLDSGSDHVGFRTVATPSMLE